MTTTLENEASVPYHPGAVATAKRGLELAGVCVGIGMRLGVRAVQDRRASRDVRIRNLAAIGADGLYRLGPTFIKIGQMIGSRRDLLPGEVCDALGSLHDAVPAMTDEQRQAAWKEATRQSPETLSEVRLTGKLLGAGSIACVYEAETPDGSPVAVKLRRPDVAQQMSAELALLYSLARFGEMFPGMRGNQFAELIDYMNRAIYGQLNFQLEAQHTERLRMSLANRPQVVVPAVWSEYSNEAMLTFDLLPGLGTWQGDQRQADLLLQSAWDMVFSEGFVHCDLHQGNVYALADGRLAILDAGYSVELPWKIQDTLSSFFFALARGDGRRCGEIMADSAEVPLVGTAREGFVEELAGHVRTHSVPGERFDMVRFGTGVSDYQRKYNVQPSPDFAFPLMSMMVLEGTARSFDEQADLASVGR